MKLLPDENLSRRIVSSLQSDYPGSTQVALAGLETADDRRVWEFAKTNDYVIVTKDEDFIELQSMLGFCLEFECRDGGKIASFVGDERWSSWQLREVRCWAHGIDTPPGYRGLGSPAGNPPRRARTLAEGPGRSGHPARMIDRKGGYACGARRGRRRAAHAP